MAACVHSLRSHRDRHPPLPRPPRRDRLERRAAHPGPARRAAFSGRPGPGARRRQCAARRPSPPSIRAIWSAPCTPPKRRRICSACRSGRADLRERHYGVLQTLTYAEFARAPSAGLRPLPGARGGLRPAGRRREPARVRRPGVSACVDAIVAAHPGGRVLVFTHGGVLDILHRRASGKPLSAPRDFEIPNTALNWLEVERGAWRLLSWADRSHLGEALDELPG
jgi:broad specificity phosphatase PhoE